MILQIDYEVILDIWVNYLWPDRKSAIEPCSAMVLGGGYDNKNLKFSPTFFGYFDKSNKLLGVNSGHMCLNGQYRSRGLFVFREHRKQGIGTDLLYATIIQAKRENANLVWSYPKLQSWSAYKKAGFTLTTDWEHSELGMNAYCMRNL